MPSIFPISSSTDEYLGVFTIFSVASDAGCLLSSIIGLGSTSVGYEFGILGSICVESDSTFSYPSIGVSGTKFSPNQPEFPSSFTSSLSKELLLGMPEV